MLALGVILAFLVVEVVAGILASSLEQLLSERFEVERTTLEVDHQGQDLIDIGPSAG